MENPGWKNLQNVSLDHIIIYYNNLFNNNLFQFFR